MPIIVRGIIFGLGVFIKAAIIVAIEHALSRGFAFTTIGVIINAILLVPIILIFAKWYFKAATPSTVRGILLGCYAIGISLLGMSVLGEVGLIPVDATATLFSTWTGYASVAWIFLLCLYAGFEFDGTYSKDA